MKRGRLLIGGVVVAMIGAAAVVFVESRSEPSAEAVDFVVNRLTPSDDAIPGNLICADSLGQCSLRAAIQEAEALGGSNRVTVPSGTHTLGAPLTVRSKLQLTRNWSGPVSPNPVLDLANGRGFTVEYAELSISGIDIINGADLVGAGGAAVHATNSKLTFGDMTFRGNHSEGYGGAVFLTGGRLSMAAKFEDNTGLSGGALALLGSTSSIIGSTFTGNGAADSGGALYMSHPKTATMSNSFFGATGNGNTALDRGGAVHMEALSGTFSINTTNFVANSAGNEGGAVFAGPPLGTAKLVLFKSNFTGNVGLVGGAVATDFVDLEVNGGTFSTNSSAGGSGGAIGAGGSLVVKNASSAPNNVATFTGNKANGNGGAVGSNAPATFTGAVFTGNSATGFGGALSLIAEATPSITGGSMTGNEGAEGAGAIWRVGSQPTMSGVTVSGNVPAVEQIVVNDPTPPDPVGSTTTTSTTTTTTPPTTTTTKPPSPTTTTTMPTTPPKPSGPDVVSLVPARLLDTRPGQATVDGKSQGVGRVKAGGVVEVPVTGRGGVPGNAAAVLLNVTVVNPAAQGYVAVFPCGSAVPGTSSVNYRPGSVVANGVLAKVGSGGKVCAFSKQDTDLLFDVTGYVKQQASIESLFPARLLDTRAGQKTVDGKSQGVGRVNAGGVIEVPVTNRGGVPGNAAAVLMNVTAVNPAAQGFVTIFPCGSAQPATSSVNYPLGAVVANSVLAKVGTDGNVCAYSKQATDLLFDVSGYVKPGGSAVPLVPARLLETRPGQKTVDGKSQGAGRVKAGGVVEVPVTGRGGVPAGASAVLLNVTVVNPAAQGYVAVFPCGSAVPGTSSVNYRPGSVVANGVLAKVGAGGKVCAFSKQDTDLLFDVTGYIKGS